MSALTMQIEERLGNSLGLIVAVVAHVLVVMLLLSSRETITAPAMPMMARIIADNPGEQIEQAVIETRPVLDRPQMYVPQPELVIAQTATKSTATAATSAATSARSTPAHTTRETLPRFDADYLNNPAPIYPRVSRRLREQGVVMLRVHVLPSGTPEVVELKTSSGSPRLDDSAVEAVRKWKFVPAQSGGRAVSAWVIVPIEFSLNA